MLAGARAVPRRVMQPISGGSHLEDLRQKRLDQLHGMTDEQFAAEVRGHQAASWRPSKRLEHAKDHASDFGEILGRPLTPSDLDALSHVALRSWDRLFTELDRGGDVSYIFVSRLTDLGDILVVATRRRTIRTAIPMPSIESWLKRHQAAVEVTDRAKNLGL